MTISKKDLQALKKDIKALERKMDKLIAAAEKNKRVKAAKKAPAKKSPIKKKTAQPTATDQVLKIVTRSKKGVNAATLMAKTGFNQKKISNIIQRIYKQGKLQEWVKEYTCGLDSNLSCPNSEIPFKACKTTY